MKKEKRGEKRRNKDAVKQRSMPNDLLCISPRLLRAKVGNPAFSCLHGQVTLCTIVPIPDHVLVPINDTTISDWPIFFFVLATIKLSTLINIYRIVSRILSTWNGKHVGPSKVSLVNPSTWTKIEVARCVKRSCARSSIQYKINRQIRSKLSRLFARFV